MKNKIRAIIWGTAIVTLIGVELKASEVYSENNTGAWVTVHEVHIEDCVNAGGIHERSMDTNATGSCVIQDFNLKGLKDGLCTR